MIGLGIQSVCHMIATVLCAEDDLRRRNFYSSPYRLPDAYLTHEIVATVELIDRVKRKHRFLDFDLQPGVDTTVIARISRAPGSRVRSSSHPLVIRHIGKAAHRLCPTLSSAQLRLALF